MSWQVRLGELDQEIQNFLQSNPEFPIRNEREFVKFAVRRTMLDLSEEYSTNKIEKEQLEKLEKDLREDLS